jgi:hypothetical protein
MDEREKIDDNNAMGGVDGDGSDTLRGRGWRGRVTVRGEMKNDPNNIVCWI